MDFLTAYNWTEVIILTVAGFCGGFIDATVGGGGLICLPVYMSMGWPIPYVLGTNKCAALVSLGTSAYTYFKAGKMDPYVWKMTPLAFCSSILGVVALHIIPSDFLRYIMVILLIIVGLYTFIHKDFGQAKPTGLRADYKKWFAIIAIVMGFYDGFFGPGSGTFYVFAFLWVGYDYVRGSANGKMLTTAAMLGALPIFIYNGTFYWDYALFMFIGIIPGAVIGSRFVITHDVRYIRPMYLAVVAALIGKQVWSLFN